MNTTLTPYQKRKHQEHLDETNTKNNFNLNNGAFKCEFQLTNKNQLSTVEIYLEKQFVFLTQHKSEILFDIRKYRNKQFNSDRNHFVHSRTVVKLLKSNKRTIRLLTSNKYISSFTLCSHILFNLTDVRDFIKSLPL